MTRATNHNPSEFTLVIERILDAPLERVWQAWTDKAQIMQWLSPKGFHVREHKGSIAPGENYREIMVSPEGEDSIFYGEYLEMTAPQKLVFTHIWENDTCGLPEIRTVCTVLLKEVEGGKTKMTFTQEGLVSGDTRDSHNGGWSECFDKLNIYL